MKKISLLILLLTAAAALPLAAQSPQKAQLKTDRDGYFEVTNFKYGFGSAALHLDEKSGQSLFYQTPAFQVQAQVKASSLLPGTWQIGWILILRDSYDFVGWQDSRQERRYPQLPANDTDLVPPFASELSTGITASGRADSQFQWQFSETIPLSHSEKKPDLQNILRDQTRSLYLTAYNAQANLYVLIREVRFQAGWEVLVDAQAPQGSRVKTGELVFPKAEVFTAAQMKNFSPELLFPPTGKETRQTWINGVLSDQIQPTIKP